VGFGWGSCEHRMRGDEEGGLFGYEESTVVDWKFFKCCWFD